VAVALAAVVAVDAGRRLLDVAVALPLALALLGALADLALLGPVP
jgi:hypothetical protein